MVSYASLLLSHLIGRTKTLTNQNYLKELDNARSHAQIANWLTCVTHVTHATYVTMLPMLPMYTQRFHNVSCT